MYLSSGFPTRSDINRTVWQQKKNRGLKFRLYEVEGINYNLCSENKDADHNLRLCFRICNKTGFLMMRLI